MSIRGVCACAEIFIKSGAHEKSAQHFFHGLLIKCIDEKTKWLSYEKMMLYITKIMTQQVKILGGELWLGVSLPV